MSEKDIKEKDIGQIVRYLTGTFNAATATLPRAERVNDVSNSLYIRQTEFAYLLNELMMGPKCMQQKYITDCNEYIEDTQRWINEPAQVE